jgi:hypothetical protein
MVINLGLPPANPVRVPERVPSSDPRLIRYCVLSSSCRLNLLHQLPAAEPYACPITCRIQPTFAEPHLSLVSWVLRSRIFETQYSARTSSPRLLKHEREKPRIPLKIGPSLPPNQARRSLPHSSRHRLRHLPSLTRQYHKPWIQTTSL